MTSAAVFAVPVLWLSLLAIVFKLSNSISPSAVQAVISTIMKWTLWAVLIVGSLCVLLFMLISLDFIMYEQVSAFYICCVHAVHSLPQAYLDISSIFASLGASIQLHPFIWFALAFTSGRFWGCLRQLCQKPKGKLVGVIPGQVVGLEPLAKLNGGVEKLISVLNNQNAGKSMGCNTAELGLKEVKIEMDRWFEEVKSCLVGCVSQKQLSDALQDVHDRVPTATDIEDAPLLVALKKATGDLQQGLERLSNKVARLSSDVATVNAVLEEAKSDVEEPVSKSAPTTRPSHDSSSSDSSSGSDSGSSDSSDEEGFVQVLRSAPKNKSKKSKQDIKRKDVKLPSAVKEGMEDVHTVSQLKDKLKAAQDQLKEERKAKLVLSEEERSMTRAQLEQKWANDRRNTRYGEREDRPLTEQERGMNRNELRAHLAEESHQDWVRQQQARGIELFPCEVCGRMRKQHDPRHACIRAPWSSSFQNKQGIPQRQEMVISATPGGVRLNRQTVVDQDMLAKNLETMQSMQAKLDQLSSRMMIDEVGKSADMRVSSVQVAQGTPAVQGFPLVSGIYVGP